MDAISIPMTVYLQRYHKGGPSPKFTVYHLWKAYDIIGKKGPIGRKTLAREINLGEGTTRTILDRLMREGGIESTRRGVVLTKAGKERLRSFEMTVRRVEMGDLTIGEFDCAVMRKSVAHMVSLGCEERDEAVRAGAAGATTLVYTGGRLHFPGEPDCPERKKVEILYDLFDLEEGDVVVIGTGHTYEAAEKGGVTAAISIGGGICSKAAQCWYEGTTLISEDAEADDLKCIALAIHELVGRLPVTMRSRNRYGVRCEEGEIIDVNYTGPVLEEALRKNSIVRRIAPSGAYEGIPIVVVPIMNNGVAVAVIGVVDITRGIMSDVIQRMRRFK